MKNQLLILCLTLTYVLSQDCLKKNEKIRGKLLTKEKTKKNSPKECLALCEKTEGCLAMAYITKDHPRKVIRKRCFIYKKINKNTREASNTISAIIKNCMSAPTPPPTGTCGVENTPNRRISGGSNTEANQYPWMVHLPMGCGGSLITDRHILTAKHCVMASNRDWRGYMVKFSVHNKNDPDDYEEVAIKDYVMPDENKVGSHDIAIIILMKPVDLSDNTIGTVCLPASADKDYRGKDATAMGWGMTAVGTYSNVLKHVNLKVSKYQKRNYLYTEVAVVNGVPQDPCAGDSGGPLVYQEESGRWTIIGTVYGWGYDCRTGKTNGKGIWNKVTDHLAWIQKVIEKNSI